MSSVEVTALIKSIQEEGQNTSSSDVSAINEPEECETDTSCTGGKQILHKKDLVVKLLANLENESDIIFDFTSLKACLNPTNIEDTDEEARDLDDTDNNNNVIVGFDYLSFVYELLEEQSKKLPKLQKLSIRRIAGIQNPSIEQQNQYDRLNYGILQLSCLSELDLNNIPTSVHDELHLWNLHNLKRLAITESNLKTFPGSVGRIRKLKTLDLSKNQLSSLPITLGFCRDLETLDLHKNAFKQLPSTILQLKNLKTLRRLENPLTPRYQCTAPKYTRVITKSNDTKKVYQPLGLQASCSRVVFTSQIDYWTEDIIGPLQCKTLDSLAVNFVICDNCKRMMLTNQANKLDVEVLLVTFAELSGVPFLLHACSKNCQEKLAEEYGELNITLQRELDAQYEESIKLAEKQVKEGKVDLGLKPVAYDPPAPWNHMPPAHRYIVPRRKRCSIM